MRADNSGLPMLIMTACFRGGVTGHREASAVDFLTKPFRDRDLLNAVGDIISRDRIHREAEGKPLNTRLNALSVRERQPMDLIITYELALERYHRKALSRVGKEEDGSTDIAHSRPHGRPAGLGTATQG